MPILTLPRSKSVLGSNLFRPAITQTFSLCAKLHLQFHNAAIEDVNIEGEKYFYSLHISS